MGKKHYFLSEIVLSGKSCKNCFEDLFEYMTVPVDDNDSADLSSWFDSTIAFIGRYQNTVNILIFCHVKKILSIY